MDTKKLWLPILFLEGDRYDHHFEGSTKEKNYHNCKGYVEDMVSRDLLISEDSIRC